MGASNRFELTAALVANHFPSSQYPTIADIAGGAGGLNLALCKRGYQVTTYDPAKQNKLGKRQLVTIETEITESLIVGLHPDSATDVLITLASAYHIPFVVIPCCVLPTITRYKGDDKQWVNHLCQYATRLGYTVETYYLRFKGKNVAIIGLPPKS